MEELAELHAGGTGALGLQEPRALPFYTYMCDVRDRVQKSAPDKLRDLRGAASMVESGAFFRAGGTGDKDGLWADGSQQGLHLKDAAGAVPPSRQESLPIRASLDHIGCHILKQVPHDQVLEAVGELSGTGPDGRSVQQLPASETARTLLLHRACDALFE